jgi:hypothetical protein
MSKAINAVLVIYALVMSAMGIEAYIVKGSAMSLAGVLFGVLMLVSIFVWTKNTRAGRMMSVVVAFVGMGRPLSKMSEFKMYPAGVIIAVSVVAILALVGGHLAAQKEKAA